MCAYAALSDVYSLGDCANVDGKSLMATAQVAEQQGMYLAERLVTSTMVNRASIHEHV